MLTELECLPCLAKNAVDLAKKLTANSELRSKVVSCAMHSLADCDRRQPPPFYAADIIRGSLALCGASGSDPWYQEKERSTRLALALLEELAKAPYYHPEDFESRLRLAVAGNILDFGIFGDLDIARAMDSVAQAFEKELDGAAVRKLQAAMDSARSILYILDNCGEAVFDRVFIEPYRAKITLAVRGHVAFNDVTRVECAASGLEALGCPILENQSDIPGTILELAGTEFQKAFWNADLVIAKGQGNFETLNETEHPMAFLFMAKCPVVTRLIGVPLNSLQVRLTAPLE